MPATDKGSRCPRAVTQGDAAVTDRVARMLRMRSFAIPAAPEYVRVARHRVMDLLGPGHPCLDAAAEVISELAANAVLYGSSRTDAKVKVRVRLLRGRRVRLAVIDEGGTGNVPAIQRPDGEAVNGRGLLIVAALACRWDRARHGSGHKIRVLLDPLSPGPDATAEVGRPLDLGALLALDDEMDLEGS